MAVLPEPNHSTAARIYASYEAKNAAQKPRTYLGVSMLGHACARYMWLTFRGAVTPKFDGRILRLFDTGNWEERRIVADLRAIGCEVHEVDPSTGRQFGFEAIDGHLRGHMDAAIKGLPEAPTQWHVAEFKTHNDKSFADLVKNGVEKSKPMHYTQMNTYCGLSGMEHMFYLAVNKNTDEIYTQRLKFDVQKYQRDLERAKTIIYSEEPPLRISDNPSWYECKMCDAYEHCHGTAAPNVTCRTCAHSTPAEEGKWHCEARGIECEQSCADHLHRPQLLESFAQFKDAPDARRVIYLNKLTGAEFTNGIGDYTSHEITAVQDKKILGCTDPTFAALREMGAEIVR